jgi:hypothetical protein
MDPTRLRPLTAWYRGAHQGDHQEWRYDLCLSFGHVEHRGRPAWRESRRIHSAQTPDLVIESDTIVAIGASPEFVASTRFGSTLRELHLESGRVTGVIHRGEASTPVDFAAGAGLVATDAWMALDLFLLALPLSVGYEAGFGLVDVDHGRLRPFSVRVNGQEQASVPAGTCATLRVTLEPQDGDRRMAATYLVQLDNPATVVRRDYVVNPETAGSSKRSSGMEELYSIELH